jgi:2-dehydropantoate 2-reductase
MKSTLPKLRFLCFGVGAIGTYIGGSLALAGQNVVFIDRPEVAEDVRQRGLSLKLVDGEKRVSEPEILTNLNDALTSGPFDAAILAVKAFDTQAFLQDLAPYSIAVPPIICLQNGVENEALIADTLGPGKVIPATVTTAIGRRGAGNIIVERLRGVGVASDHILAPTLAAVMDASGLKASLYPDATNMKWSKMLTNLLGNATSAILNQTPAEIYKDPDLYALEVRMVKETLAVMEAQRIRVVNLPGTPVRAMSWLIKGTPLWFSRSIMAGQMAKGRGNKMPSFHIDLYGGRGKSEVDYLNGAVVRFGERLGIKTPVNRLLNQVLTDLTKGDLKKEDFAGNKEKLLSLVKA